MKLSVEEATKQFGIEAIKKLEDMVVEPTGRYIYPAFEPQHVGMDEYATGIVLVEGGEIRAYYFQPVGADDWEFGEMNGVEYGQIDNIEFTEKL